MSPQEIQLAESLRWCLGVLEEAATTHGLGLTPLPEIVQARAALAEHDQAIAEYDAWAEAQEAAEWPDPFAEEK
jgi:hypothetical protein